MSNIYWYKTTKEIGKFNSKVKIGGLSISAYSDIYDKIGQNGNQDSISKPFKKYDFYTRIYRVLP